MVNLFEPSFMINVYFLMILMITKGPISTFLLRDSFKYI